MQVIEALVAVDLDGRKDELRQTDGCLALRGRAGDRLDEGRLDAPLDRIPLFLRDGARLPVAQ
ncbi:hypothetical protein FB563_1110 [Streptomyces puniciscabiei]|uniref:Uncharacterized protein n=1 Tax=Streptomyces puniciscabiei TaxID=164348 RepID=A0A542UAV0_9ACTN|nr:hypothetical protein [Streptomyces puniciscabiei]TQK96175.1 hypothetical protein FB563_1110 [Streptomyces puniciscabiei]